MVENEHLSPDNLYSRLKQLPKIELHRHLEGSLRLDTLCEIAREHKLDLPGYEPDVMRPLVQIVDSDPNSSQGFLEKFTVLRLFYRSPETIERVTYEAIADANADNVKYMELRFTPRALAATMNYPLEDVTDWVIAATKRASQDFDITVKLIVSMNRHEPVELGEQIIKIAADRMSKGIVGLDLAGDEMNFRAEPFAPIFKEARQAGLKVTVHAGEWAGSESVREAIELLDADRLGHGVHIIQDSDLMLVARERYIALEVCVTSNLQSGAVKSIEKHPLRALYNLTVPTTINTDDPSISDVTLTDELVIAVEDMHLSVRDIKKQILNAARVAFLPDYERIQLIEKFKKDLFSDNQTSPT